MSAEIIYIDVSDLAAPEPLEKVLELLARSQQNDIVCMIHRLTPVPLFNILTAQGYRFSVLEKDNQVKIYIWHAKNLAAEEIIEEIIREEIKHV